MAYSASGQVTFVGCCVHDYEHLGPIKFGELFEQRGNYFSKNPAPWRQFGTVQSLGARNVRGLVRIQMSLVRLFFRCLPSCSRIYCRIQEMVERMFLTSQPRVFCRLCCSSIATKTGCTDKVVCLPGNLHRMQGLKFLWQCVLTAPFKVMSVQCLWQFVLRARCLR